MSSEKTDASGDWRTEYDEVGVDPTIEPDEECDHPECDERDNLERCVILGGPAPEVRVTCPTHRNDVLDVST